MPTFDLTEDERAALSQFLRQAIEADRYPLSPRWRPIKAVLEKLDPPPARPEPAPQPPPRPYVPSSVLAKKRGRRQVRSVAAVLFLLTAGAAAAANISGTAGVVDGDTIELSGQRIRLWGIDAPEQAQRCQGRDGRTYECGRDAAAALAELTRGRRVDCRERDRDRHGRVVAVCSTEAGELNAAMVRRGWAVDYTRYSGGRYRAEEAAAKGEGLGLWSGRFEMPAEWRQKRRP